MNLEQRLTLILEDVDTHEQALHALIPSIKDPNLSEKEREQLSIAYERRLASICNQRREIEELLKLYCT